MNKINRFPELLALAEKQWLEQRPDLPVYDATLIGRFLGVAANVGDIGAQALKTHQISQSEHDVMACMRRQGKPFEVLPSLLLEEVRITSGALTTLSNRLIARGLCERVDAQHDKRAKPIRLTQKGVHLIDEVTSHRFSLAAKLVSALSETDKVALNSLMGKLQSQVQIHSEQPDKRLSDVKHKPNTFNDVG